MTQATAQHTPGEWYATPTAGHEAHGQSLIIGEGGATVAIAYGVNPGDAALIAAAPAMSAALERARDYMQHPKSGGIPAGASLVAVLEAIAQARGEG